MLRSLNRINEDRYTCEKCMETDDDKDRCPLDGWPSGGFKNRVSGSIAVGPDDILSDDLFTERYPNTTSTPFKYIDLVYGICPVGIITDLTEHLLDVVLLCTSGEGTDLVMLPTAQQITDENNIFVSAYRIYKSESNKILAMHFAMQKIAGAMNG